MHTQNTHSYAYVHTHALTGCMPVAISGKPQRTCNLAMSCSWRVVLSLCFWSRFTTPAENKQTAKPKHHFTSRPAACLLDRRTRIWHCQRKLGRPRRTLGAWIWYL